jgi:hypothetical protein
MTAAAALAAIGGAIAWLTISDDVLHGEGGATRLESEEDRTPLGVGRR